MKRIDRMRRNSPRSVLALSLGFVIGLSLLAGGCKKEKGGAKKAAPRKTSGAKKATAAPGGRTGGEKVAAGRPAAETPVGRTAEVTKGVGKASVTKKDSATKRAA